MVNLRVVQSYKALIAYTLGTGATLYGYNYVNPYNITVTTDGTHISTYTWQAPLASRYQQNVSIYNVQNLVQGEHTLMAKLALQGLINFDWVYIYTNESYELSPITPASQSLESYAQATSTSRVVSTPLPTSTSSLPGTHSAVPASITTSSSSPSLAPSSQLQCVLHFSPPYIVLKWAVQFKDWRNSGSRHRRLRLCLDRGLDHLAHYLAPPQQAFGGRPRVYVVADYGCSFKGCTSQATPTGIDAQCGSTCTGKYLPLPRLVSRLVLTMFLPNQVQHNGH